MTKHIRFTIDSSDRPREWRIWTGMKGDVHGIFYTDGLVNLKEDDDFKMKEPTFKEAKEKNVGKANYMSPAAQAEAMLLQEIGKKERKNYFKTIEEARSGKIFIPMLCPSGMKWKDYANGGNKANKVTYPVLASAKLDGARANVYLEEGTMVVRTRSSKPWFNFEHIKVNPEIKRFLDENPNIILDGEMYNHDYKDEFEELMSVFRKKKPTEAQKAESARVAKYYVYDIYDRDNPSLTAFERQQKLIEIYKEYFTECDLLVPTLSRVILNEEEFDVFHEKCMDEGYEGTILRMIDAVYGINSRSGELLKRKDEFDCEFEIVDVIEGTGTNKGIAAKVIIKLSSNSGMNLQDLAKLDLEATQSAGMAKGWNHDLCRELLENKDKVIGQMATINYFGVGSHGKCRFPKMKTIRDYE